ncbi:MAG: GNAT family N-acetyltransferase [Candidatus Hodarchaeales archaeon]
MNYNFEIFDPKIASEKLWEDFYSHHTNIIKELFPDDPLQSKEMIMKSLSNPNPNFQMYRWVVRDKQNNMVIGLSKLECYKKGSPSYEANKNITFAELSVRKEYRRKGIGSELVRIMLKKAQEEEKEIFQSWGIPDISTGFFANLGGIVASKEEENRLKVSEIDWDMIESWRKDGSQRATGVSLDRFINVSEEDIKEYCQIFTEVLNQIPKEDIEWEETITPESRRISEKRREKLGNIWTTIISREADGTISGLTETVYDPDRPTMIFQGLTGVKVEYREKGLGKWLKAEMLR